MSLSKSSLFRAQGKGVYSVGGLGVSIGQTPAWCVVPEAGLGPVFRVQMRLMKMEEWSQ